MNESMKAVRIHSFGGTEVLRHEDAPMPELMAGDILVRVHASAVNPLDLAVREGEYEFTHHAFPMTLGWDFAGTVEDLGTADTKLSVGDTVFGRPALARNGTYAQFLTVDPNEVAKAPMTISLEDAAALPLATLTAWKSMFEIGRLTAGQTVLIQGGSGGVGTMAVQLAHQAGAHVVATASGSGADLVRSLGADEVIDYRTEDVRDRGRFADVVVDTIGEPTLDASYSAVLKGGHVVSVTAEPDEERARREGFHVAGFVLDSNGPRLAEIAALVDAGKLRPVIHRRFDLDDVAAAHVFAEQGHLRGKIVLRVEPALDRALESK